MRRACLLQLAWLSAAGLFPLAARHFQEQQGAAATAEMPAALSVSPSDLREELFAIEQIDGSTDLDLGAPAPDPGAADSPQSQPQAVGVARCRRLTIPDGQQLEWDVQFLGDAARVLHIERTHPSGDTLVWREILPSFGRTISARRSPDATSLSLREWAGRLSQQSELASPAGVALPLNLLEQARAGAALPGAAQVFDPLSRELEPLTVRACDLESGARRIDLARDDGTLAGRWLLQDGELVAFQWQAGNLRGCRISAEEYERLLAPPER